MSVIDLSRRITNSWNDYNIHAKSYESHVFINPEIKDTVRSDTSIDITVGDYWYDSSKHTDIAINEKGIKVKAKKYIVFQTEQEFGIPYNVYGLVVGKGINSYNGGIISTGKIVPGYKGKLRIGYYNAGKSTIIVHKGDVVGCCVFFNTELTAFVEYKGEFDDIPVLDGLTNKEKMTEWIFDNWYNILSLIFSIIAVTVAIITLVRGA